MVVSPKFVRRYKEGLSRFLQIQILVVILALQFQVCGQAHTPYSKNNLMAEFKMQYGFFASHHLELDLFQSHFPAFEFTVEKATWGKQRWEVVYAYPIIGLSVWYSPLGGFSEIGSVIAVYPFINFPLVKGEKQSLNFRLGLGIGYLTNHYNRTKNYKNFAIGSNFNFAGSLFLEYRRTVSKMITLTAGLGLTHFSNGATKTPNFGMNQITATIGITTYLRRPNPQLNNKILPKLYPFEFDGKKSLDFDIGITIGLKDMTQQFGERFMVYAIAANIFKQVSWKSKFGIGFDLTYDGSDNYVLEWNGTPADNNWQILKPGISAAYQLLIGRVSFMFNFGLYLAGKERSEGDIYQKLTLRYLFTDHFFASLAVNSNWGKAEYVGFGVGYQLDFIYKRTVKH